MSEIQQGLGESEAVILVKAAPQVGTRNGETVCCAGLGFDLKWVRLYPIKFRRLDETNKFSRWDRVRFSWRRPSDDQRLESRRVAEDTLHIVGKLNDRERGSFLSRAIVSSLKKEREAGRSLALIQPEFIEFFVEQKSSVEFLEQKRKFEDVQRQGDLFAASISAYRPCPFTFKFRYRIEDGIRTGTCQDWELEATFFRHSSLYGEKQALEFIQKKFGEEYPRDGMLFAMGTHSIHVDTWLLNGVIRYKQPTQASLL